MTKIDKKLANFEKSKHIFTLSVAMFLVWFKKIKKIKKYTFFCTFQLNEIMIKLNDNYEIKITISKKMHTIEKFKNESKAKCLNFAIKKIQKRISRIYCPNLILKASIFKPCSFGKLGKTIDNFLDVGGGYSYII